MSTNTQPPAPVPPAPVPPPLGAALTVAERPTPEQSLALYQFMLRARKVEERVVQLYRQGEITGGCYSGMGNEATSVGTCFALAKTDVLVPTHRDLGAHLVHGHTVLDVARQYLKRASSQTGGKDSGLHLGKEHTNIVGMISHLAHMMPVAVGVALAERQKGSPCCVLTTVGDGASSLGDFHESLNFAAVQKLPVLFVIENNQYAYSTPVTLQYACARLSDRALGYGMVGAQVDGTDVLAVWAAARDAVQRGRSGAGPTLLECVSMRMRGHSEHDDAAYVPPALLNAWKNWDPVERMRQYLLAEHVADALALERIAAAEDASVNDAFAEALQEPKPSPTTATEGVFRVWSQDWTVPSRPPMQDDERLG